MFSVRDQDSEPTDFTFCGLCDRSDLKDIFPGACVCVQPARWCVCVYGGPGNSKLSVVVILTAGTL